jgi:hypothetical protein
MTEKNFPDAARRDGLRRTAPLTRVEVLQWPYFSYSVPPQSDFGRSGRPLS